MASPITWQNVQGRSLSEAAIPMQAASQSILGGFDRLGKVLDDYQGMEKKKLDMADEVNVQGFLDRLQSAGSPEEVAALQASWELERYTSAINNPANLAKLRGAGDARTTALMQQLGAKQEFGDKQLARDRLPGIAKANEYIANNDEAGLKAFLDTVDLGDESKFIQQMYATARTRNSDARADELAPLTHKNAIAAAEEAQLAQAEKETARRLEAKIAEELAARTVAETPKLGTFPKVAGFSAPQAGITLPAPTSATDAEALNESIMRGGTGLLAGPRISDTATADAVVQRLRKSGEFSPEFIEKNLERIRSSFDSTSRNGKVGNDASASALDSAMERVQFDERSKVVWGAPGSPTVVKNFTQLMDEVPALIDKTSGLDPEEDVADIRAFIHELAIKGIQLPDGKYVTPAINDVRALLQSAEGGWFTDSTRKNNMKKKLEELAKTPEVLKRVEEAKELEQTGRKLAVRDLLNAKK